MRWTGWPPPDEEGERTRRLNKHNNQIDHRRGGEDVGDGSDNDNDNNEDNNNNDDEATEQPWLWWWRVGCRVVVEVMGETIAAIKLAEAPSWSQLWTDGTTRRQIPFTALVIGLMGNGEVIDPIVVPSCIFMEDERSETQADGIINKVIMECVHKLNYCYRNIISAHPMVVLLFK
jgi:hypothetical protein